MERKMRFISLFGAILGCVFLAGCGDEKRAEGDVLVGISLPLSGEFAFAGDALREAASLAVDEVNKRGGKYHYRLIIEDDAFEAKKTAAVVNKFINTDKVDAIISFASQAGNIVAPLAERHQIIHINFGATDEAVLTGKYNFVHWTPPAETTRKLLDFFENRGWKKVVVIAANNAGTLSLAKTLFEQQNNYPQINLTTYYVQPAEKDFRMLLAEVKRRKPDVVLVLIYGGSIYPFIKQYRQQNLNFPLANIEAFSMLPDFSLIDRMYLADVAKGGESLEYRLKKENPHSSVYAIGNIYDAVMLISEAFENSQERKDAVDVLKGIKIYEGSVGKLEQDSRGFFAAPAVLEKVENGRLLVIEN